jgi:hypothetical protein
VLPAPKNLEIRMRWHLSPVRGDNACRIVVRSDEISLPSQPDFPGIQAIAANVA